MILNKLFKSFTIVCAYTAQHWLPLRNAVLWQVKPIND